MLVCFEPNEFYPVSADRKSSSAFPTVQVGGDRWRRGRDAIRVDEIIGRFPAPRDLHAAGLQARALMEDDNAWQAVRNNVLGTWQVARSAVFCVPRFVLVSTDKAVNPTNVMGATKRPAERVPGAGAQGKTQFEIVRLATCWAAPAA